MPYWSKTWSVEVRDEVAKEFVRPDGLIDDMLAGLHEIRARLGEKRVRAREPEQEVRTGSGR